MTELRSWLAKKLDVFELRIRAAGLKRCHDMYYCAGWADGYKAAQRDARRADKISRSKRQ